MQVEAERRKDIIGNYQLGKTLGEGTFGKVKAAIHIPTNEPVAIKILDKSRIIDTADVQRVSRQIHILKLVRHPNIIQLYQLIETPKYLLLVMEYATNGELFDHIVENKKLSEPAACQIFQQIINGIQYVHKLNVVHRDLKPENLLIDYDQSLKIVDFGLSNTYKKNELLATACGSPCYASPQMIRGNKYSGLTTDIWSAGVILFAMVCGYLPFEDPETSILYDKIKAGKYKLPKDVSSSFKNLLAGILDVNPDTRMRIDDIKSHEWWQLCKSARNSVGIMVGYDRIPIDLEVLAKLQALGYDTEHAQRSIQANRHNSVTTSYYLLLKKNRKNGVNSKADIASSCFDPKLLAPLKKSGRLKTVGHCDDNEIEQAVAKKSRQQNSYSRTRHYSSLSKHVPPPELNLGRSSTNQTEYNGSISKMSQLDSFSVKVSIPSRSSKRDRYHIPSTKVRRPSALTDSNNSYSRTQTYADEPTHYANLIERHYRDLYRRPLVSKSREKDHLARSNDKQKAKVHNTSIQINRSFMDQSSRLNNPMAKMRDSINRQRERRRPEPLTGGIFSKSTEKAYMFLRP